MQLSIPETVGHVVVDSLLSVQEPREVIAEAAAEAAETTTEAPAAVTGQQEQQDDPGPVAAPAHTIAAIVIAAKAGRAYEHRCGNPAVFVVKSHS